MLVRIASRDSDRCVLVFASGAREYGLLDAGLAGTATLVVAAGASGLDTSVIKPGALVQIMAERGFPEWVGLITSQPAFDGARNVYSVQAVELHGFLADIQSVSRFVMPAGAQETGSRRRR